jgi:hypothetical protein
MVTFVGVCFGGPGHWFAYHGLCGQQLHGLDVRALDVKTEQHLYELLLDRDLAFISVGHRPTLVSFHDTVLELIGNGDWRMIPTASYDVTRS